MDIIVWMLTGAALGWVGYSYLALNQDRGIATSIIIGVVGGVIGGRLLAPMFSTPAAPGEFSIATVLLAAAAAAGALAASNLVHKRWGV